MENQPMNPKMNAKALTGLVLNIQHFCTHDGPGIRTTVFLKGMLSSLQVVLQSREHPPEAGTRL